MTEQNTTALPDIIGFTGPQGVLCPQFESVGSAWHQIWHKKRGSLTVGWENLFSRVGYCHRQVEICWASWWGGGGGYECAGVGAHDLIVLLINMYNFFNEILHFRFPLIIKVKKYFDQINVK